MDDVDSTSAHKQLPEVGVHKQKAIEDNDIHSVSKLFEYKPDRKDSKYYFLYQGSKPDSKQFIK